MWWSTGELVDWRAGAGLAGEVVDWLTGELVDWRVGAGLAGWSGVVTAVGENIRYYARVEDWPALHNLAGRAPHQ